MNTIKSAARKLLNWRESTTTLFIPADLLNAEELAESLQRRWVCFDEAGYQCMSNNAAQLEDMATSSLGVGDTVTVGEDGQTYTGTVQAVDGRGVKLTFGDRKPRNVNKTYRPDEVKQVATPDVKTPAGSKPTQPTGQPNSPFTVASRFAR